MTQSISREQIQQDIYQDKVGVAVACVITTVAVGLFTAALLMHPTSTTMMKVQFGLYTISFVPGFIGLSFLFSNGFQLHKDKKLLQQKDLEC